VSGAFDGASGDPTYAPVDENHQRWPGLGQRVYGATKILCEELGLHMAKTGGP
jgi:nucleoside-diphosphate-sugar epimerase